ncbi:hypothetical protein BJX63DRAFT_110701 [Aspergillus granulosus]|uniref:Uncharacterized protein n=1 Tax=Aspergillus granulosus TaxID=176169 RepID=A0ABR4HPT4_9EURO
MLRISETLTRISSVHWLQGGAPVTDDHKYGKYSPHTAMLPAPRTWYWSCFPPIMLVVLDASGCQVLNRHRTRIEAFSERSKTSSFEPGARPCRRDSEPVSGENGLKGGRQSPLPGSKGFQNPSLGVSTPWPLLATTRDLLPVISLVNTTTASC